jgi:type I restriction enzyme M protein
MNNKQMLITTKDNKIFAPLKEKWLILTPEEKVRQEFVCRLVNEYGYDLKQMAQEAKVSNSKRGQGKARADIVIWKSEADKKAKKAAFIVVECKAANVKIQQEDYYQGLNYATWAKAQFFVTTNEKEVKFFKVLEDKIPDELSEISDIPKAKDVNNDKEIKRLLEQTKVFTRDDFQRLLFTCHNVIRNNDKLSPEMAFDEISKILFMKIRFERKERSGVIFSQQELVVVTKYMTWKTRGFNPLLHNPPSMPLTPSKDVE